METRVGRFATKPETLQFRICTPVAICAIDKVRVGAMPPTGAPVPAVGFAIMKEFVFGGMLRE